MPFPIADEWPYLSCFRDVASFPLKNAHFSYPPPFNPNFENIFLALDR